MIEILRRLSLCAALCGLLAFAASAVQAQTATYQFDLPAQPLADALRAIGRQTSKNILFDPALVEGISVQALRAELTVSDAVKQLLAGTKLSTQEIASDTVLIRDGTYDAAKKPAASRTTAVQGTNGYTRLAQAGVSERSPGFASDPSSTGDEHSQSQVNRIALEEIIVTGTNIRGVYPASSPVEIYTAKDIARSGATTTEQFIRKLPQNLSTRTEFATGSTNPTNSIAVNSIDLRGLGVGTTLVLMNGRRMGLTSGGQAVDISQIPVSAIERVEVLTDGASAIYGSDAIGGVVNFVLREDFEGAETRLGYAGVSSGSLRQSTAGQTFGHNWGSGNALLSYDYYDAEPLNNSDRSYATRAGAGVLTPNDTRHGVIATLSQSLSDRLSLDADLAWSRREVASENTRQTIFFDRNRSTAEQFFANAAATYDLSDSLEASVLATYSSSDTRGARNITRTTTGAVQISRTDEKYDAWDLTADLDGKLFSLSGGDVRYSLGAGYMQERFESLNALGVSLENARNVSYAFAEAFVPLLHNLDLSIAARYTRYEDESTPPTGIDFDSDVVPRIGLHWAPLPSLGLRATYGESFRAASLTQTNRASSFGSLFLSDPALGGRPDLILTLGPAGELTPETATSYTLGLDVEPQSVPGLRIGATYFDISYEDRIAMGAPNDVIPFLNPSAFPELFDFAPTAAEIEQALRQVFVFQNTSGIDLSNPATAAVQIAALPGFVLYDNRNRNLARSEMNGVDFSASYTLDLDGTDWRFGGQVTRIFDYIQQTTPTSPVNTVIDTVTLPVSLRGRAYAGFTHGGYDSTLSLNYVDDYSNPFATGGAQAVQSWTTVDVNVNYGFGNASGALSGVRLSLSVQNLFDEDPPFVADSGGTGPALRTPVGFDPRNANPLGRFVAFSIAKAW